MLPSVLNQNIIRTKKNSLSTKKEYINKEEFVKIKTQALIIDVRDKLEHQTPKTFSGIVNIIYENLIAEPEKYIADKSKPKLNYKELLVL